MTSRNQRSSGITATQFDDEHDRESLKIVRNLAVANLKAASENMDGYLITITFDPSLKDRSKTIARLLHPYIESAPSHCWNVINEATFGRREMKRRSKGHTKLGCGFFVVERYNPIGQFVGPHIHGVIFVESMATKDANAFRKKLEKRLKKPFSKAWSRIDIDVRHAIDTGAISYCLKETTALENFDIRLPDL